MPKETQNPYDPETESIMWENWEKRHGKPPKESEDTPKDPPKKKRRWWERGEAIDDAVEEAEHGRKRKNQSTDEANP